MLSLRDRAVRLGARAPHKHAAWAGAAVVLVVAGVVGAISTRDARSNEFQRDRHAELVTAAAGGFSDAQLQALMAQAGPGAMRIASRIGPDGTVQGKPSTWADDLLSAPTLQLRNADADTAAKLNAAIPISTGYNPVAKPFEIGNAGDRSQALGCLTAAVYYEAANEPRGSQEGVAQVVLNRVRHPAYPKSVCGVVFQGSERFTGCQFSFTCDGSMARTPARWKWAEARDVAEKALNGYVFAGVGSATHYHASYVMPYWSPTLIKVAQFGLHIFYRPAGPALLNARYGGGEARYSRVDMIGKALPARAAAEAINVASLPGSTDIKTPLPSAFVEASLTPQGRIHAVIAAAGGAYATKAPMHEMVLMRAAMAKEAMRQRQGGGHVAAPADDDDAAPAAAPAAAAPAATSPGA
jgi:spore germination cell wall hydrolase CwlJ-like protein